MRGAMISDISASRPGSLFRFIARDIRRDIGDVIVAQGEFLRVCFTGPGHASQPFVVAYYRPGVGSACLQRLEEGRWRGRPRTPCAMSRPALAFGWCKPRF